MTRAIRYLIDVLQITFLLGWFVPALVHGQTISLTGDYYGPSPYNGTDNPWNTGGSAFVIGVSATGSLTVSGPVVVNSTWGYVGNSGSGDGTATITGAGAQWNQSQELWVGNFGTGELNVLDGGSVSNDGSFIGREVGSSGAVTVDGTGSTWTSAHRLRVGNSGIGTLDITNGGGVDVTDSIFVGSNSTGDGTVTVSGASSQLSTDKQLAVGHQGTGSLTISAGGSVSNIDDGNIGNNSGATGTVTVDGVGSTWINSQSLRVGASGEGTLNVQAGGSVSYVDGFIGATGSAVGTATVAGAGSQLNGSGDLYVGPSANGTLNVQSGGVVSNANGFIGVNSAGTGMATVTGAGSQWNNSGNLYIAGNDTRVGGTGSLTIQDSGHVSVTGTTKIWGPGSVTLDGGNLTTGSFDNSAGGTFNHNDGTLTVDGGTFQPGSGTFSVDGADAASHATLTLKNGATWTSSDPLLVGNQESASMNIQSGAVVSTIAGIMGTSAGSDGTVSVTGAGSRWNNAGNFNVGQRGSGTLNVMDAGVVSTQLAIVGRVAGGTGIVTVTGAGSQLNTDFHITMGFDGNGELTVESGGAATSGTYTTIGDGSATGTVTVTDTGSLLQVGTDLFVGGNEGAGTLNVLNGAQVSVADRMFAAYRTSSSATVKITGVGSQLSSNGNFYVGGNPSFAGGTAVVDVENGGAVNVGDTLRIYNGGSVTRDAVSSLTADHVVTSGSLNWDGTLNVSSSVASSAVGDISAISGGSLNGDTLHIYSDGSVALDSSASLVANHIIADGNLDWSGGTLNVSANQTLTGSGDLSGVSMVTVANGGMISPGNSTGTMTAGAVTWGSGGMYDFEINDFNGTAGSSTLGWDLLNAGTINITATGVNPFEINLLSLTAGQSSGLATNFDFMSNYSLLFASATGGITGFSTGLFSINTSGFQNSFAGDWSVSQTGNNLFLNYAFDPAAVPEPSSIVFLALGTSGLVIGRRNRRKHAARIN